MLEDVSSNGIWRNGARLERGVPTELAPGDVVCFLPVGISGRATDFEFEVVALHSRFTRNAPLGALTSGTRVRSVSARERSRSPQGTAPPLRAVAAQADAQPLAQSSQARRELSEWIREADNGCLAGYEATVMERFSSLEDVRARYSDNISAVFTDLAVKCADHRTSFRRALMRLRNSLVRPV